MDGEEVLLRGRRYPPVVREGRPEGVRLENDRVVMTTMPTDVPAYRETLLHSWYADLLVKELGPLIGKWEHIVGVHVRRYDVRRLRSYLASCSPAHGTVRFSLLLATRPGHLVECLVAYELCHLREPGSGPEFQALLESCYPNWREAERDLRNS